MNKEPINKALILMLIWWVVVVASFYLAVGCGRSGTKSASSEAEVAALQHLYGEKLASYVPTTAGWPSDEDCDGSLWAGVARRAGVTQVDTAAALQSDGRPTRKPHMDCGPEGTPGITKLSGDSASTVSNDMFLGIMLGLVAQKDLASLERLFTYGKDNNWIVGTPSTLISRVLIKPTGIGLLAQAIKSLGGTDHLERHLPNPILPVQKDYEEHLQILGVQLSRDVGRSPGLPSTCSDRPGDALIQAVCGNTDVAIKLLLDAGYVAPTYVRGADQYTLVHWLMAAKVVLGG